MSWTDANNTALAQGGKLASINSAAENAFLTNAVSPLAGSVWVGGIQNLSSPYYSEPAGGWQWSDGSPFSYMNWNSGEPNNVGNNEHYIEFKANTNGKWNDLHPNVSFPSVVEFSCLQLEIISGLPSGHLFPIGTTIVEYKVTNQAGLSDACSFRVTVTDVENPLISCPSNMTVEMAPSACGASVSFYTGASKLFAVTAFDRSLVRLDPNSFTELSNIPITPNYFGTNGMAQDPTDGQVYIILSEGPGGSNNRFLAKLNLSNGNATIVGNTGRYFSSIAFSSNGTLYGVTGNADVSANSLFIINKTSAMPTFLIPLNHSIGHALAFNPDDGLLYHWSYPLMEKIDLTTFVVTNIPTSGQTTSDFPMAAAYMGSGKFLLTNINNEIISVTSDGNGTFLAWSIHLKGIIQTIPEYGITASDNCAFTLSQTAGLASGSFFPEGTTTNTFVATDASGNSTPCSFTVTVKNDVKPEVTCPSNITVNIASGICGAPVTFTVYATDNCTFIANLVGLSSGSTFPIGTTTNLFSATDPSNNTATCSFTVTVNEDQNLPDFIIYATEDVKFGEYNYIGGDVGVTGAKGKANFKKYVVLDPFHVTAADIKIDLPSNVTYTTSAQATGGPNPTFYPYNGSTIGLNNIDVNTNTTLNGNYKDVKVKKGVTVTLNGNNFGKMTIEEGATVTFTASIINMEELKVNKGKKNESTTVVNFSQPASVKVADKVSVEDDAHVNVGGPKVTFYVGDNHGGDESFKVNGDNTRVTANIMIPKGKLKVTGGGSPTRPTFMTGWYIIEKLEANGKYTYWDKYDCSTTPSLSSAREKVVSDIRVRAELERNVITFVSNQGDKTDYWTAEKRHETTGTFEKLEIRNNVKSNEALQYLTFYDNAPSEGDNFYRIKLSLAHGDVVYSAVEKVYHQKSDDFIVYPNPSDDEAWINLTSFEGRQVTLVLSDVLGKTVHQQVIEKASAAPYRLDVANMPSGLYLIKVQAQGKRVFIRKLQVAR